MRTNPIDTIRCVFFKKITNRHSKPSIKQIGAATVASITALNAKMAKENIIIEDNRQNQTTYAYVGSTPSVYLTENPDTKYSYSKNSGSLSTEDFDISFSFNNKKAKVKNFELKKELEKQTIIDRIKKYTDIFLMHYDELMVVTKNKSDCARKIDLRKAWGEAMKTASTK